MFHRLCDVVHSEKKLTLVFEYSDQDLKKYFDSCNGEIDPDVVKVWHTVDSAFCPLRDGKMSILVLPLYPAFSMTGLVTCRYRQHTSMLFLLMMNP